MNRRDALTSIAVLLATLSTAPAVALPPGDQAALLATAVRVKQLACASIDALRGSGLVTETAITALALPGGVAADDAFSLFFAGSQIMLGNVASAAPIVGFYNPIVDGWWLSQWQGSAAISAATLQAAPLFVPVAGRAPWQLLFDSRGQNRTMIESLRRAALDARDDLRSEVALQGATGPRGFVRAAGGQGFPDFMSRTARVAAQIDAFGQDEAAFAAYGAVSTALTADEPTPPAILSAQARQAFGLIAAAPLADRIGLLPVAAIRAGDSWLVVAAAPTSPRALVLMAIAVDGSEPVYRLTGFGTGAFGR